VNEQTFQMSATGVAVVCCVHDQEKRAITDLRYDKRVEKVHVCACCENLFTRPDDVPHYCEPCGGRPVHPLMAPLPVPVGEA
jgi:hypothetical protein